MLNWAHIDSVLLDLDGTLLDLHYDNYFWREFVPARYAQNRSLSLTDAKAKLLPRMLELQGTLEWYCVDFWSRELDLDILALKTELRHLIKLRPGARSFLSYLQTRPQRVSGFGCSREPAMTDNTLSPAWPEIPPFANVPR